MVFVRLGGTASASSGGAVARSRTGADPSAGAELEVLAGAIGGTVVPEAEPGRAEELVRSALGVGAVHTVRERRSSVALAPLVLVGSLVPLAVLVRRRNRA